jgi:hypothetical protein
MRPFGNWYVYVYSTALFPYQIMEIRVRPVICDVVRAQGEGCTCFQDTVGFEKEQMGSRVEEVNKGLA